MNTSAKEKYKFINLNVSSQTERRTKTPYFNILMKGRRM
jgi:hypothetical protein